MRVAGHDILGADEFGVDETARQRSAHFACAQKTDGEFGCHESFVTGHLMERKGKGTINSALEFAG